MPAAMPMASIGLFESTMCSLGGLLPGSQGAASSQADGTSLRDASCGSQSGSSLPSFGLPCSSASRLCWPFVGPLRCVAPRSCLPSGGSASVRSPSPFLHGHSTSRRDLKRDLTSLWCHSCQPIRLAFGLIREALGQLLWPTFALGRQRLVHAPAVSRQPLKFAPCLVLCPGHQRLELSSDDFLSLASGFDAGGTRGQGWCCAHNRQRSPLFVRSEFGRPRARPHLHPRLQSLPPSFRRTTARRIRRPTPNNFNILDPLRPQLPTPAASHCRQASGNQECVPHEPSSESPGRRSPQDACTDAHTARHLRRQ